MTAPLTPLQAYALAIKAAVDAQTAHEAAARGRDPAAVATALARWQAALAHQDQARHLAQSVQ